MRDCFDEFGMTRATFRSVHAEAAAIHSRGIDAFATSFTCLVALTVAYPTS